MAKEILEKVNEAENECERIISTAKAQAKDTAEAAKAEADRLVKERCASAQAEAERKLGEVKAGCDSIISEAEKGAERTRLDLSFTAEKNRNGVIKAAVEKFF